MNAYVGAGYGITLIVLVAYSLRVLWRERSLHRALSHQKSQSRREDA